MAVLFMHAQQSTSKSRFSKFYDTINKRLAKSLNIPLFCFLMLQNKTLIDRSGFNL